MRAVPCLWSFHNFFNFHVIKDLYLKKTQIQALQSKKNPKTLEEFLCASFSIQIEW